MKKGMVFDLYQDGRATKRVVAISDTVVMDLNTGEQLTEFDFEDEVSEILIDNIFDL